MDKATLIAWAIKNSVAIISWAVLAMWFDKWWIALFGVLFLSGLEMKHRQYRVCDKCGKRSPYAETYNEALDKAKEAGWVHYVEGNKDYCPTCSKAFVE